MGHSATILVGGSTRTETVAILANAATRPYLLLQEVARPFSHGEMFAQVLASVMETGIVCTAAPASRRDGLAMVDDGFLGEALPLNRVVCVQTPQAYDRALLIDIMNMAREKGWNMNFIPGLFRQAGHRVRLASHADDNLKITFPEDWDAALLRLGD